MGGEFWHVSYVAHIFSLIVTNDLKDIHELVVEVRSAVKFVRSSLARLKKFMVFVHAPGIKWKNMLCSDVSTRWKSTFLVKLEMVERYRLAFYAMGEEDNIYICHFEEKNERLGWPTNYDCDNVQTFVEFLRIFCEVTYTTFRSFYVTSNKYRQQVD